MTFQKRLELDRKKRLEEEKFNAIYKMHLGMSMLALYEDCNLSSKTLNRYNKAMQERNKKYFGSTDGIYLLAIDLLKCGIKVLNINCDENENIYPQYAEYWEEGE